MINYSGLAVAGFLVTIGGVYGEDEDSLAWVEGSTTLVILPDTERYSDDYPDLFEAQTK